VPRTALQHFQQDIDRARVIAAHADALPHGTPSEQLLRSDLWRSAWMFGVGALDAYFCDAYTDIVAATIIAKSRHAAVVLPEFFHDIRLSDTKAGDEGNTNDGPVLSSTRCPKPEAWVR
jgi:hypothetical protein